MPVTATPPNLAGRQRFPSRRRAAPCPPREAPSSRRRAACDAHAVELAYDDHAQRGLEHDEAVAATAVQLLVSVHRVQRVLAARAPAPTLAALATSE
jgi:hypothetical protein